MPDDNVHWDPLDVSDSEFNQNDIPLPEIQMAQANTSSADPPMVATLLMRSPQLAVASSSVDSIALLERGRGEKARPLDPVPPVPMHNVCMHPYFDSQKTSENYGGNSLLTAVTMRLVIDFFN